MQKRMTAPVSSIKKIQSWWSHKGEKVCFCFLFVFTHSLIEDYLGQGLV